MLWKVLHNVPHSNLTLWQWFKSVRCPVCFMPNLPKGYLAKWSSHMTAEDYLQIYSIRRHGDKSSLYRGIKNFCISWLCLTILSLSPIQRKPNAYFWVGQVVPLLDPLLSPNLLNWHCLTQLPFRYVCFKILLHSPWNHWTRLSLEWVK